MKRRTARRKYLKAKLHTRRKHLSMHVGKELKSKLNKPLRSILVNKGDKVKVLRGEHKGKTQVITEVSYSKRKVYLDNVVRKNARGNDIHIPFDPSNLELISLKESSFRNEILKPKKGE